MWRFNQSSIILNKSNKQNASISTEIEKIDNTKFNIKFAWSKGRLSRFRSDEFNVFAKQESVNSNNQRIKFQYDTRRLFEIGYRCTVASFETTYEDSLTFNYKRDFYLAFFLKLYLVDHLAVEYSYIDNPDPSELKLRKSSGKIYLSFDKYAIEKILWGIHMDFFLSYYQAEYKQTDNIDLMGFGMNFEKNIYQQLSIEIQFESILSNKNEFSHEGLVLALGVKII